jgi:GTP-binding protein EngB required for normal cell division
MKETGKEPQRQPSSFPQDRRLSLSPEGFAAREGGVGLPVRSVDMRPGENLRALECLARDIEAAAVAEEAHALAERAAEGRFFVACIGQFKRGKSTLLNALVGAEALPTGTVPVTSVVTVLRYGESLSARLRSQGAEWEETDPARLVNYVSEERNPGNAKGVTAVEVFAPSPLLASGLCFVDTPGLGSVISANSAATREFVPHVDAALVVFGADPPISGDEMALVEEIAREVETFVFVLNKADRVTEVECEEAVCFAERVLAEKLHRPVERMFRVSALERLTTGQGTRDWDPLTGHLQTLAEESGWVLVVGAVQRGLARLGARLGHILAEEAAALQRPLAESEHRLRLLRDASNEASRALWELGPLFDAELQRLSRTFSARRAAFLKETRPEADAALSDGIRAYRARSGPDLRRYAFLLAQEIARERVKPWLAESEREAGTAYRSATVRFTELVNSLLARLRASDAWTSIPLPEEVGGEMSLKSGRYFTFHDFHQIASPAGLVPVVRWLADLLLPRRVVLRQAERDAWEFLHHLLETNAARVENSLKQRLQDSRMKLESELRFVLKEMLQAAERGMERARVIQVEGEAAVRTALAGLKVQRTRLEDLLGGKPGA